MPPSKKKKKTEEYTISKKIPKTRRKILSEKLEPLKGKKPKRKYFYYDEKTRHFRDKRTGKFRRGVFYRQEVLRQRKYEKPPQNSYKVEKVETNRGYVFYLKYKTKKVREYQLQILFSHYMIDTLETKSVKNKKEVSSLFRAKGYKSKYV